MLAPCYVTLVRDLASAVMPKKLSQSLRGLVFWCLLLSASAAHAVVQPIFGSAQGPTLLPGSDPDLTEDAQYIYQNVALSTDGIPVDAIVTIVKLKDMDIVGHTIDNVLSEDYRFEPLTNAEEDKGYVEWQIKFVQDGTVINAGDEGIPAYLDSFTLEAIDVDGKEFFAAIVTNSYTLENSSSNPTDLVVSTKGDFTKFQSGSNSVSPISALDTQYIVRINYENVHVITFRNGSAEENDDNNNRQNSVSFTGEVVFDTPDTSVINSAPTVVDNTGNTVDVNDEFEVDLLDGANDVDGNLDEKTTLLIDPSDFTNTGSDGNPLVVPGVGTYDVDNKGELTFTPVTDYFGPASILFSVSDDLGVSSNRGSLGLMVIDPNLPVVAITSAPLATLANQATYPVSGTCTVGDGDVTVSIPGATPPGQAVSCSAGGTWSAIFDVSAIADGPNAIAIDANQTDAAGNTGNALPVTASKDASPPTVVITGAPIATLFNQAAYPVIGTCTVGDGDVTVDIAGATPGSQAVSCNAGGTWSANFDVSAIGDGPGVIDITAAQTDAAGNTGNATPVEADKNTIPPMVSISSAPTATLANQATYPVGGTCTAGDGDVTVSIAGATPDSQAVSCGAGGTWSAIFDVSAIGDGANVIDVDASQTDVAGNIGNALQVEATKDTFAPIVMIDAVPVASEANQMAYPVSGTCTAGDGNVTVSIAGPPSTSQAVICSAGGTWSVSFDVSAIADGPNAIVIDASQTDAAGNTGSAVPVQASKDSNAPLVATTSAPLATLANQAAYPVSGTCTADDGNVTVSIAGATPLSQLVICSAGGTWSASFDVSAIGDGTGVIDIDASQTDAAGNTGNAILVEADKDTLNLTVEILDAPAATVGPFNVTFEFSRDVTGFALGDIIVGNGSASNFVIVDGNTYTALVTPDSNGDITIDIPANIAQDAASNGNLAALQVIVLLATDADDDGIPDNVECPAGPPFDASCPDSDGDGTPDFQDPDSDNDGVPDNVEVGNDPNNPIDTDGDGIPDYLDQDSDNNGIPDDIEIGNDPNNPIDTDGDGIPDYLDQDSDNNGIPDDIEIGNDPNNPIDTDGDGIPDYLDQDSDNNGIPDDIEIGNDPNNPIDTDGDGIPDYLDQDSDNDGIPDGFEIGNDPNNPIDSDGDGIPDYLDQDSDNDGIPDSVEGGSSAIDTDGDGIPDILENGSVGTDVDNDGIDDALDVDQTGGTDANGDGIDDDAIDRDGDGVANYLDLDSDNDGIPDLIESGSSGLDANGNDIDDAFDFALVGGVDANMDGIVDTLLDTDSDAIADQFDLDADADGINDLQESGLTPLQISNLDTDNNAVIDAAVGSNGLADAIETEDTFFAELDQNGDGLVDTPQDTDGDTRPDFQDLDADNDGIHDLVEGSGLDPAAVDINNDGVVDDNATDADNDGISDSVDSNDIVFGSSPANDPVDTDGDLVADFRDLDTDNDGISDLFEAGILDPSIVDTDNNGELDNALTDDDNDGIPDGGDSLVGYGDPQATGPVDTDGDGLPDIRDLDSDNDSIPDVVEGGNQDNNGDGLLDPGGTVTSPPPDTDNDGLPDYVDPDSNDIAPLDIDDAGNGGFDGDNDGAVDDTTDTDMDGVPDVVDGDPTVFGLKADNDNDGIADALDLDDDNDGIPDIAEDDGTGNDVDTDGDGLVDRFDHDSDNDGLPDSVEAVQAVLDADADGFLDNFTDANNDGLDDGIDPAMIPLDTDGDTNPDFRDLDSDDDLLKDTFEANALSNVFDLDDDGNLDSLIDADLDGLTDIVDPVVAGGIAGAVLPNPDTDGDGLSNYRDPDSDNDGLADALELLDSNGDGIPDGLQQGDELETAVRGSGSFGPGGLLLLLLPVLLRLRKSGGNLLVTTLVVFIGGLFPASVFSSGDEDINYCGRHNPLGSQDEKDFKQCFYIGLSWLAATHVDPEGTAFGWSTSDDSDSGYKLFVGWHFKPRLFGELSYADLGDAGLSNSDPAITGTEGISYKIPGLHVGYYLYEPEARFNIYGKVGISSIDNEATTSRVVYDKQNSVGVSGGLGLQWRSSSNGLFARLAADFYDEDASSIGLSLGYYFGGSGETRQAAVDLDSDADGVMDSMDSCPDSAFGAQVDATGCVIVAVQEPEPVVAEVDSDADGVVDSLDACPDSEKGAQVDASGCVALVITQINLTLEGVFFATNSAELTVEAQNILDKAVMALKASPAARVEVQAHTDSTGEADYNQNLSTWRAENVRDFLISHGIAAERLTAKGYGETKPKATNETREGRARNRRVEFKVIEKGQDG